MAAQCLCFSQVPSLAILLVGCREPGRARGTLFRGGVRRLRGSRGVSGAPCSPQYWPIVDVDVAGDSHRPAGDMNAVGPCGKGGRVRGADGCSCGEAARRWSLCLAVRGFSSLSGSHSPAACHPSHPTLPSLPPLLPAACPRLTMGHLALLWELRLQLPGLAEWTLLL